MLNFYPSPIECLIYRAQNKPREIRENKEEQESSRKIVNELSNISDQEHQLNILKYDQADRDAKMVKQQNNESGNKIAVELQDLEKI